LLVSDDKLVPNIRCRLNTIPAATNTTGSWWSISISYILISNFLNKKNKNKKYSH